MVQNVANINSMDVYCEGDICFFSLVPIFFKITKVNFNEIKIYRPNEIKFTSLNLL